MGSRYFLLFKPYGYLSQFSDEAGHPGLRQLIDVPKDVYSVGRLDHDSEGLLILTNDKSLNKYILDPSSAHERAYWVQVDGAIEQLAIEHLKKGVDIRLSGTDYSTRPAKARIMDPPDIYVRVPAIRKRVNIPTSWIFLSLTEGKNRQVRKMTAAVGHPTLRLVRYAIGGHTIDNMQPGQLLEMGREDFMKKLRLG